MEFQIDTRNHRTQEVRVGRENQEIAVFRKAGFFIHNLVGKFGGCDYQMKLAAPWNGFRYELRQGKNALASAKKRRRMHAFEPDRPLVRHHLVEFELEIQSGRVYQLTPKDRFGLLFALYEGDEERGRLTLRDFEAQRGEPWQADLKISEDWSVPLAAFLAWLAREGRSGMGT